MAKSKSKAKKLEVLISEVAKLKRHMKLLLKRQTAIATAIDNLKSSGKLKKTKKASKGAKRSKASAKPEKK